MPISPPGDSDSQAVIAACAVAWLYGVPLRSIATPLPMFCGSGSLGRPWSRRHAVQAATFAGEALRRFANPALGHTCAQVGADGSSKLPQRLLPVVAARKERALDTAGFAVVVAIWIAATAGIAVRGVDLPQLEDPIAGALRAAARRDGLQGLSHAALGSLADGAFTAEVASALQRLTADGPAILETGP